MNTVSSDEANCTSNVWHNHWNEVRKEGADLSCCVLTAKQTRAGCVLCLNRQAYISQGFRSAIPQNYLTGKLSGKKIIKYAVDSDSQEFHCQREYFKQEQIPEWTLTCWTRVKKTVLSMARRHNTNRCFPEIEDCFLSRKGENPLCFCLFHSSIRVVLMIGGKVVKAILQRE